MLLVINFYYNFIRKIKSFFYMSNLFITYKRNDKQNASHAVWKAMGLWSLLPLLSFPFQYASTFSPLLLSTLKFLHELVLRRDHFLTSLDAFFTCFIFKFWLNHFKYYCHFLHLACPYMNPPFFCLGPFLSFLVFCVYVL